MNHQARHAFKCETWLYKQILLKSQNATFCVQFAHVIPACVRGCVQHSLLTDLPLETFVALDGDSGAVFQHSATAFPGEL